MKNEIEACLIKYIADEWRSLRSDEWATRRDYSSRTQDATLEGRWNTSPEERWPWGAWICQHDSLAPNSEKLTTPLRKAWFLSEEGLRQMNPWSFLRFWTVQFLHPWATPDTHVLDAADARPRRRMGFASFAEIIDSDEIYVETVWGGLWARGRLITIASHAVQEVRFLWIA